MAFPDEELAGTVAFEVELLDDDELPPAVWLLAGCPPFTAASA